MIKENEEMCKGTFPIVYSDDYNAMILGLEKMHGLDHKLPFYVYRKLEEEEILDSKPEQEEWEDQERDRVYEKAIIDARRKKAVGMFIRFISPPLIHNWFTFYTLHESLLYVLM